MKKIVGFSIVLFFATSIMAQQVRVVKSAAPGWRQLGTTVVKFTTDKDFITVAGNDWFRKLKFQVIDASIQMLNMTVIYENGAPDNIPLNFLIPKGAESRLIDLRGGERKIRRVEFLYRSGAPGFRGRAKLILFGFK